METVDKLRLTMEYIRTLGALGSIMTAFLLLCDKYELFQ